MNCFFFSSFNSDENDKDEQAKGEDPSQVTYNCYFLLTVLAYLNDWETKKIFDLGGFDLMTSSSLR